MTAAPRQRAGSTRPGILLLLLLAVALDSVANVLLRIGMRQVGDVRAWSPAALAAFFAKALTYGTVWLGIAMLIGFFMLYLLLLSRADYSYVQPASASVYALVPLLGFLFLGETVAGRQWIGIAIICAGVLLVGRTAPRTGRR